MKPRRTHRVKYARDEAGWWIARVVDVEGCHTQGRTIEQARRRVREALSLFIGDVAERAELRESFVLPAEARRKVEAAASARERVRTQTREADEKTRQAAKALTQEGLSLRDTGELLGLSRQRVHQMLHGE
jgi:predicted RNase H-like HicB family nuclease